MKKALASALALTMVAGMTSVAFATTTDATGIKVDSGSKIYLANEDDLLIEHTGELLVKPGQSIYVELLPVDGDHITNKLAGQSKILLDWSQGKELVESTGIENKKVSEPTQVLVNSSPSHGLEKQYDNQAALEAAVAGVTVHDDAAHPDAVDCKDHQIPLSAEQAKAVLESYQNETATSYKYVAEIKLKSSYSAKQLDLLGTLKAMKKNVGNNADVPSLPINAVVGYAQMDANDSLDVDNDTPVVSFEDVNDEIELLFGTTASFTVNVKGQGNLYLGYSLKPVAEVVDQNEDANIDFISFPAKPSFNRIGTLRLFADRDSIIYELTGNGLKKLDATYDEDYEAFAVDTRTLGSYVISDSELQYTSVDNGDSSSSSSSEAPSQSEDTDSGATTTKPNNPNTGAGSMAGVAMGLAGISLVAGAVAKKPSKK